LEIDRRRRVRVGSTKQSAKFGREEDAIGYEWMPKGLKKDWLHADGWKRRSIKEGIGCMPMERVDRVNEEKTDATTTRIE